MQRPNHAHVEQREPIRRELNTLTEQFLATGGVIAEVPPGATGDQRLYGRISPEAHAQRIRASHKSREQRRQASPKAAAKQTTPRATWMPDDDEMLLRLRAEGKTYAEIAVGFPSKRTVDALRARHSFLTTDEAVTLAKVVDRFVRD